MRLTNRPVLCNYYVTYRCNAACDFCDIWEKPSPYVTLENVKKNLQDLKRLGVKVIDFTGGEPLLHRDLPLFLEEAKRLGFTTTVTTNCLLYPKHAEKLRGKIDMLHFSLDSPVAGEHNRSRNVDCFDHLVRSIYIAKSLGERPDILFTVFNENIHHLPQMYHDFAMKYGLILILNPVFRYNNVGAELSPENLDILSRWGKRKNVYLNDAFIALRREGGNHIERPVCKAASTTVVISPENKMILPCYHLEIEAIPIDDNLYALRHSPEMKESIAMEGKYKECEGCTINCYFQSSFAVDVTPYFFKALPSTLKYGLEKWVY